VRVRECQISVIVSLVWQEAGIDGRPGMGDRRPLLVTMELLAANPDVSELLLEQSTSSQVTQTENNHILCVFAYSKCIRQCIGQATLLRLLLNLIIRGDKRRLVLKEETNREDRAIRMQVWFDHFHSRNDARFEHVKNEPLVISVQEVEATTRGALALLKAVQSSIFSRIFRSATGAAGSQRCV
jgi:hypothetical protein